MSTLVSSFQQQHFTANNLRLSYAVGPRNGVPLALLHGVARNWTDFAPLLPALTERFHVHALDFRGHGQSDRASEYLVVDYARDAAQWIEQLARETRQSIIIFGHSLGAMVAASVAARLPQAVCAVVLGDPPYNTMGANIHETPYYEQFIGMRALAQKGGITQELASGLAEIKVSTPNGEKRLGDLRDSSSLRQSAECLVDMDAEVFTPVIEGRWLQGYDKEAIWREIRCPMLLLQADSAVGGALIEEDAQHMEAIIPDCNREKFLGVGHLIHWQQPEKVLHLVNEFAASLS